MHVRQHLVLPTVALFFTHAIASAALSPLVYQFSLQQQPNNRTDSSVRFNMEPAKVAQTAELIGVEQNVGTWSIGHATKDFLAGEWHAVALLLLRSRVCLPFATQLQNWASIVGLVHSCHLPTYAAAAAAHKVSKW
jgi:hypothetical protein